MATFKVWNRQERKIDGEITITKEEVLSMEDCSSRTGDGATDFQSNTRVELAGGKVIVVGPMGEFEDRLNDDNATAPGAFEPEKPSVLGSITDAPIPDLIENPSTIVDLPKNNDGDGNLQIEDEGNEGDDDDIKTENEGEN